MKLRLAPLCLLLMLSSGCIHTRHSHTRSYSNRSCRYEQRDHSKASHVAHVVVNLFAIFFHNDRD